MLSFLLISLATILANTQIAFLDDFQSYNTGINKLVYLPFAGAWYRADVDKFTGVFKVKGPNLVIPSKYLAVFAQSATSVTCIDISLSIQSVYQLSYDHTWEAFNTSTLFVFWNNALIESFWQYGLEGRFIHSVHELPCITQAINQLCFSGFNSFSGIRIGLAIDNVQIVFIRSEASNSSSPSVITALNSSTNFSASNISQNSTNSSGQIFPNNFSTIIATDNQTSTDENGLKNPVEYIKLGWVRQFVEKFNYALKFTSFFGFSYLISNLLNFWNIIVIYYFLQIRPFLGLYKLELQQLCRISLQQNSLLSLLQKSLDSIETRLPHVRTQKIPPTYTDWPSFLELGLTSQILINNIQSYFGYVSCLGKFLLMKFVVFCVTRIGCEFSGLFKGKIRYIDIFCYEIVSSSPSMLMPIAIMLSANSSSASTNFPQKLNTILQIMSILAILTSICLPILLKKCPTPTKPQKQLIKSTLIVQSQHQTSSPSSPSIKIGTAKLTQKMQYQLEFHRRLIQYYQDLRAQKYVYWVCLADTFNHVLFFTVGFGIGLNGLGVFFGGNFVVLLFIIFVEFKKRSLTRCFNPKEFWFAIAIKFVFITIHLSFFLLYLHQEDVLSFSIDQLAFISFLSILLIVVGALIQTIHSIANLLGFAWQFIKKIKQGRSNKISHNIEKTQKGSQKKTTILSFHLRKISIFRTSQTDSISQSQIDNERHTNFDKQATSKKMTGKTERISRIIFDTRETQ